MMGNIKLRICTFVVLLFAGLSVFAQQMQVKGTVVDKATGETVIGASVLEEGTRNGTVTDIDGNFVLSVPTGASISITYIGYKPVSVKAAPSLRIEMEGDNEMLEEVVVTGYMTEKKASLTGSVSVVKMADVADIPENAAAAFLYCQNSGIVTEEHLARYFSPEDAAFLRANLQPADGGYRYTYYDRSSRRWIVDEWVPGDDLDDYMRSPAPPFKKPKAQKGDRATTSKNRRGRGRR